MMHDLNNELGKLVIRVFVQTSQTDDYGRLHGHWRAVLSQYCRADDTDDIVARFKALNPHLITADTHAVFTVKTHTPI